MNLTQQQMTDVLAGISGATGGTPIVDWIAAEGLTGITPQDVRSQLRAARPAEVLELRGPKFISTFVSSFIGASGLTVGQCNSMLSALQDAEVLLEAKKTELGG